MHESSNPSPNPQSEAVDVTNEDCHDSHSSTDTIPSGLETVPERGVSDSDAPLSIEILQPNSAIHGKSRDKRKLPSSSSETTTDEREEWKIVTTKQTQKKSKITKDINQ